MNGWLLLILVIYFCVSAWWFTHLRILFESDWHLYMHPRIGSTTKWLTTTLTFDSYMIYALIVKYHFDLSWNPIGFIQL